MQVESGTSFERSSGKWFKFSVTVSETDFPNGTYDKLAGLDLWRALATVGELYVLLEVARVGEQYDAARIALAREYLQSKELPL